MKFLGSILETFGVKNLPISSYLNWSDIEFEKKRKARSEKYKKYGGEETFTKRREVKKQIKIDVEYIKGLKDIGIYFIEKNAFQMQFFTLTFYNVRYKEPIISLFKKWNIDPLAAKTHFSLEDRLNRIHFVKGVDPQLRGTGLSELLYKEFIHYIGWSTSNADALPGVKAIWSKIAKDDDFWTVVTYFDVLAISKKKHYQPQELKQIVMRFLESKVEDVYKYKGKTEIDLELLEMFPELKDKYYRKGKVIKRYEKILTKELTYLPFINDSLVINIKGKEEYCLIRDVYFTEGKVYYWCVVRSGHMIISPYIEEGEIGFSKVSWKEVDGIDKYTILQQDVDVVGVIPNIANVRLTRRNVSVQDLIDGVRLTYIPKKVIYNREELHRIVFTRTRVKNSLEVRISYKDERGRLQLIKNHDYYKRMFIAR
jgi:hypothetical protein